MQLLSLIALLFVLSGIVSAALIALDLRTRPQTMRIMTPVWILTGLWAGIPGLWAYYRLGRSEPNKTIKGMDMPDMKGMDMPDMRGMNMNISDTPAIQMHSMKGMKDMQIQSHVSWRSATLSTLHCGAGCTLADLVGEWFFYFIPIAVGGSLVAGSWIIDYALALLFGIGFQYAAIRGMNHALTRQKAITRATKADILSLTAWQIGMYIWMGIAIFGFGDGVTPPRTSAWFWFMMQIAMYCGFLTALPVNVWLIRKGVKKGM